MPLGFITGDTVDVALGSTVMRGEVTRIVVEGEEVQLFEIQRPGGSHIEFLGDEKAEPGEEFAYATKVE